MHSLFLFFQSANLQTTFYVSKTKLISGLGLHLFSIGKKNQFVKDPSILVITFATEIELNSWSSLTQEKDCPMIK